MPSREMTLEEWVTRLPWSHRARQEFEALRAAHQERDADAKCRRIGGCLLAIGAKACCCQTGTCDGAVVREALRDCEEVLRLIHEAAGPVPKDAPMPRTTSWGAWKAAREALGLPTAPGAPEEGAGDAE